jgi:hypothetical protein
VLDLLGDQDAIAVLRHTPAALQQAVSALPTLMPLSLCLAPCAARNSVLLEQASEADLHRVGIHAEPGEQTLKDMVRLCAGHDLLHLRQLDRIRGAITS